ncbi:ogr/Delta-like zinc finger family protein [Sphingomonas aracearum]|uniref:ogr/Delta-like zinc finger family protein n=1 Tax=Sphingomonas aracearum TaxID=2283317 RepID=UPI001EEFB62F|nr:ogr/Delta-like zinc finger family protein [Sphingomonas aracearum]
MPGITCPHCDTRAIARDSVQADPLTRVIRFVCDNPECGHVFIAQLAIYRTLRPSAKPNPAIVLPLGQWRGKPANDDETPPANDDTPPAGEATTAPS